ncbi:MAG: glutathione S-transferase N-terminal domain-containing protein [Nevskiales bacterium]
MNSVLDVTNSVLASSAALWRGSMGKPASRMPDIPLELYDMEGCPYCRLVREALTDLDIDAMIYPCPKGGERFRPKVTETGGQAMFPYLVDPNNEVALYESADIIKYLYTTYGGRRAPLALRRLIDLPSSMLASGVRGGAGIRVRPSRAPKKALELFSFESSPYSRRVRELLCELELPYLLRNTGKALVKDIGPPGLRATFFPDLPVVGRNRRDLLERTGKVQVPYLVDPNTGKAMYESDDIKAYLMATYAA